MNQPIDYDTIAARCHETGGCTIDIGSGHEPTTGYAVALAGHEERHTPRGLLGLQDALYVYVINHGPALCDPGAHLGVWLANDWVFDVVHVFAHRADAEVMAAANQQEAFYSLHENETIWLTSPTR